MLARGAAPSQPAPDAKDLAVQDTFDDALRGYSRFQPGTNLHAWLMTIMHHLFIDRCPLQGARAQT